MLKEKMIEEIAALKTVRPGRTIYVRKILMGNSAKASLNVIAVHGLNGTQLQFAKMIEAMSKLDLKDCGIIFWCYDMVGCGKSPPASYASSSSPSSPSSSSSSSDTGFGSGGHGSGGGNAGHYPHSDDDYSDTETVLDLRALITDLVDIEAYPSFLLGHSYGTTIIFKLLQQLSIEKLYGLIIMSAALRGGPLTIPDGGPWIFHPNIPLWILQCVKPLLIRSFVTNAFHEETDPFLIEEAKGWMMRDTMQISRAYLRNQQWATVDDARVARECPTLILHGTEDNVLVPGCGQHMANSLERSRLQFVERSSHMLLLEQPQQVASLVFDFLMQIQCVYVVRDGFPPMS